MRTDTPHLLYVDDEQPLHNVLQRLFSRHGIRVTAVPHAKEAIEQLRRTVFDLVLTDFKMPDMDGLELLAHVRQEYPDVPVIMITAHASVQHAVGAMQGGAVDYIPKPFSTAALLERVRAHLDAIEAADRTPANGTAPARRASRGEGNGKGDPRPVAFVGSAPSVEALRALIARIAPSQAPVFVHGESGTGKEIISRLLHAESDRVGGPFVAINCANLPRELVESHLFGHRKGAFTGAVEDMTGAFERASGGTLLLDEITEIDLPVQAKLLRVLQEQEFYKV
ncbi:MAG TPA: sigma-54 dependent transcriptional regulator, partial [Rhodothermales bacterium]|nr:sigma-54 dependent transcriptional regulator [Rhodothermales bacterium]